MTAPSAGQTRGPGVHFPPPFVFAGGFLCGLALERWIYRLPLGGDTGVRVVLVLAGWMSGVVGVCLILWGLVTFVRARTAVMPIRPARRLVQSGPYRFTRNPMYVGLSALYVGVALVFNLGWPVLLFPLVLVFLYRLVIRKEEGYLAAAFGEEYTAYTRAVRRWL